MVANAWTVLTMAADDESEEGIAGEGSFVSIAVGVARKDDVVATGPGNSGG